MKKILFAVLLLAGCEQGTAADGYAFGQPEYDNPNPQISFVYYDSIQDMRRAAPATAKVGENRELMAWGEISRKDLSCTIHMVRLTKDYQPEWLGHEVAHCIHGRWHD